MEGWNLQWIARFIWEGVVPTVSCPVSVGGMEPTVGSQISIQRGGAYSG